MKKTNLSEYDSAAVPTGERYRMALAVAEWNSDVTEAMAQGAVETLLQYNVKEENIKVVHVPGSYELTAAADMLLRRNPELDAVICIGCVIQGETRHFDFICQAVSQGLTNVSLKHEKPVIFSLLTTNTMEQALARSGGAHGNKGVEGAITALKMANLWENEL
ncbi:MAG: 6,7-dimethyl-8-ribityllumazine synthase [Bacteroidales bacterium]|nr:6,7-dimethyl-8-ribityllumazine synthase [Bacteroidales bacterium]